MRFWRWFSYSTMALSSMYSSTHGIDCVAVAMKMEATMQAITMTQDSTTNSHCTDLNTTE